MNSNTNGKSTLSAVMAVSGVAIMLVGSIVNLYTKLTETNAALTEVETQFRAHENYYNLMRADQLRTNAILWNGIFKSEYPSAAFYPSISR